MCGVCISFGWGVLWICRLLLWFVIVFTCCVLLFIVLCLVGVQGGGCGVCDFVKLPATATFGFVCFC